MIAPAAVDAPASLDPIDGTRRAGAPWYRRHAVALGLLAFTALSFAWFGETWLHPLTRHAGVIGDPESYMFALAWPPYAVAHHMNPFYTTWLVAPTGANLMWTVPPGFGLLLWPFTASIGLVLTYNLFATFSLAFSAWTAQLALRRFVPGELGPWVGGLFYGFSPYMAAHSTGHAMLTVAILPPLLLLLLHEAFVRQRWSPILTGIALGALVAFQISTFLELVAGGAVAGLLFVVLLAVTYRRQIASRVRYAAIAAGVGAVSFFAVAAYPLWTLVFGDKSLITSDARVHPGNAFVADLYAFVVPSRLLLVAPLHSVSRHFTATGAEANAYIGVPLLLVVGYVAVRHWRSAPVRIATILTVAMAILSLGPRLRIEGHATIPLPWALVEKLPLLHNLLPVRLSVFTDLGVAFLLAYGIGHRVRPASTRRIIVRTVAGLAVLVTLLPSSALLDQLSSPVVIPSFFKSADVKKIPRGSIALVLPWTTDPSTVLPELWQATADFRFKLPSGYVYLPRSKHRVTPGQTKDDFEIAMRKVFLGRVPPDLSDPSVRTEQLRLLREHKIATVVIGPMKHQREMIRYITDLVGRPPEHTGGVYVWYGVGPE